MNTEQEREVRKIIKAPLNWDVVVNIARENNTIPLVNKMFKEKLSDEIPSHIKEKFKKKSYQNQIRNLYILAVLSSLVSLFKNNEIDIIPFKGLLTAYCSYGDIGLRSFSDIDLLVKRDDVIKAWGLLCTNGFKPELELNWRQLKKYIKTEDNILFTNKISKVPVELHWEMTGIYLPCPLYFESVESRIHETIIHEKKFNNLSREDQLVYLCIHGAKHEWENIEQISSVAGLMNADPDLDWQLIEKLATKWRCVNLLLLGLYLSKALFDINIPKRLEQKIANDKNIEKLGDNVLSSMLNRSSGKPSPVSRLSGFHIKNKDRLIDKILHFLRLMFRPTKKDWMFFPVWAPLSFVLYILRPIRLVTSGIIRKKCLEKTVH